LAKDIIITAQDLDALSRLAQAEATSIAAALVAQGIAQDAAYKAAYASIVDTVINRVASNSSSIFGSTIIDVINKPVQFEPVTSANGNWQNLPEANQAVYNAVRDHIIDRTKNSAGSTVSTATHYLNPTVTGSTYDVDNNGINDGWENWGEKMANRTAIGSAFNAEGDLNSNVNAHVFGNANRLRPDAYTLSYDENGDGQISETEKSGTFEQLLPRRKPNTDNVSPQELNDLNPEDWHRLGIRLFLFGKVFS